MNVFDAIIVGGGPAGCSAAARLALSGARVVLLEKSHMPRHKLCGEFITPECFPTLKRLGVLEALIPAGAQQITKVGLISSSGRRVDSTIAEMCGEPAALSLSRARFDKLLWDRAESTGAICVDGFSVKRCLREKEAVVGVEGTLLKDASKAEFHAPILVDASGRNSRLIIGTRERLGGPRGSRLFALKTHLEGVDGLNGGVELYFFRGGYGGLSPVENGLVNLCFITDEARIKAAAGDELRVVRETVLTNTVARERLHRVKVAAPWCGAGPLVFGRRNLLQSGVLAIGDASGMIDPFTGTGIQMALRTGELAAEAIVEALGSVSPVPGAETTEHRVPRSDPANAVLSRYSKRYEREFGKRMKIASLLRAPAFRPRVANVFELALSASPALTRRVLQTSRCGYPS